MNLFAAQLKADQILDEERQQPSTRYEFVAPHNDSTLAALATLVGPQGIQNARSRRPRQVHENSRYKFKSTNFDLLVILLSQVNEKDRSSFFFHIWSRINNAKCCRRSGDSTALRWNGIISELSLVAEFSVRHGNRQSFFGYFTHIRSLTPGVVLMLMQLEELLSYNFNILSDTDIRELDLNVRVLRRFADERWKNSNKAVFIDVEERDYIQVGEIASETVKACEAILEQCRKARYFYLKGALLQETNLEVNQDKVTVESYLRNLGFNKTLVESLNHAEDIYRSPSPFELKSSMGHLRSFLENLHAEAAGRVAKKANMPSPTSWGANILYLRQNGIMSLAEEQFLASLYRLISDQAVHSLSAEREYARVARNVVIEYGLVLLSRMDKAGLTP